MHARRRAPVPPRFHGGCEQITKDTEHQPNGKASTTASPQGRDAAARGLVSVGPQGPLSGPGLPSVPPARCPFVCFNPFLRIAGGAFHRIPRGS
ncbi:hypothetical protein VFPBJ_06758 [Purpureocillium lilacinum]|uniref:Uncharacterized protein n=1 Tax=Purpureocillium lilacinum TaxID=33203 RepID=A0A179GL76_PURLI|nr:hypothetical protein VFPBJ_06758 [Purpureocillium lilacinum]